MILIPGFRRSFSLSREALDSLLATKCTIAAPFLFRGYYFILAAPLRARYRFIITQFRGMRDFAE